VAAEAARVAAEVAREAATGGREGTSDVIQLRGLRKVYPAGAGGGRTGGKPKVAVRGLSFGVPVGEVFGFLGINGAGKSTSMGVLTGETLPTRGTAKLAGLDIVRQQPQVRRLVGYCPQFDALIDNLTLREHLLLFARIKGVPEGAPLAAAVAASMHELGITEFAHKLAARLSGGTKRKLCLAIALICRPPLLVLDEPTTGVDAISRRRIWKTLQTIANRDRLCSILLTTHSMEEAEALCTRVGIMVGGRLRCLGTCQHLKARHGSGSQLDIRVRNAPAADIARALAAFGAPPSGLMLPQAAIAQLCRRLGAPRRAAALAPSDEEAAAGPGAALGGAGSASGAGEGEVVVGGAQALAIARAAGVGIRAALAAGGGELAATAFAEWWANEDAADAAIRFVCADAFPGAHVVERHGASLRFNVPSADARGRRRVLSESFETLEAGAARLGLETFTLGVTSLESVFLGFAGQQEEETAPAPGMISRIFMRK
jgi:ATP-binding cassette subfamily A (ABC1) protein 1